MRNQRCVSIVGNTLTFALFVALAPAALVPAAHAQEESPAPAAELSVDEIVNKTNRVAYYQGKDGRAKVTMTITDKQGRVRNREFTILRYDVPGPGGADDDTFTGDQKFYVYFHRPADVNKMAFMVWKHVDSDDDRWLYLPALDLVKRIASAEKRTSFVGSDFFYEDVSGRNLADDTHELKETTNAYYVLKNVPKDPGSVEFSHFIMWIHKKTFVNVKIEYFNKEGEKYRVYEAKKVETIDGFPTVVQAQMSDMRTGSTTTLEYSDVAYNVELREEIFEERYLRRAPMKDLR